VAIAYRDEVVGEPSLLRPESLLYGRTEFWPTARAAASCADRQGVLKAALFLNYTPIAPQPGSHVFVVDVGKSLQGNLVALTLTDAAGTPVTITRKVWTLDGSIETTRRRSVGERIEESGEVRQGPPDRVTLNIVATDKEGRYVPDLGREDLSVIVENRRIDDAAILDLVHPSPGIPIRLLIAVDVSTFLEQGGAQARFNEHYEDFVDHVVIAGLDSLSRYVADLPPPVPPVEVGLVRYALSAQWLEDPFWRADRGLTQAIRIKLREFLLTKPSASWLATGFADADASLDAMRRLWHYFEGRRALLVLPRGAEAHTGRGQRAFLPPKPEVGADSIETVAAQFRDGEEGPVANILQHTERRYPTVYTIIPVETARAAGGGHDWVRKLADATGGLTLFSDEDLPERFAELLRVTFDDLRSAHLITIEVANDAQQPRWKKVSVRPGNGDMEFRAPTLYESSGDICYYVSSYLLNEDPITRLVAANEAAKCWQRPGLQELLFARLHGKSDRETDPLVREEIFRSYLELTFRRLRTATGKQRKTVRESLDRFIARMDDDALKTSYTAIADRVMRR